jgi:hypothetical protein
MIKSRQIGMFKVSSRAIQDSKFKIILRQAQDTAKTCPELSLPLQHVQGKL